jgi:hypothetical protein
MRRDLCLPAVVSKQNSADSHTGQKHEDDLQTDYAAIPWGTGTDAPQLLVQKFLVTLVHLSSLLEMALMKRTGTSQRSGSALTVRNSVYQFSETAMKFRIEDLF